MADISEDMECLCHLMKTCGSQLDVVKARVNNIFYSRIIFLLIKSRGGLTKIFVKICSQIQLLHMALYSFGLRFQNDTYFVDQ